LGFDETVMKQHMGCNRKQYDNSSRFCRDYLGNDCGKLLEFSLLETSRSFHMHWFYNGSLLFFIL